MYDDWDEDLDFTISEGEQYVLFSSNDTMLALPSSNVVEIIEYPLITAIPLANESVLGVANVRGNIVGVIDLSKRIWDRFTPITNRTSLIIVRLDKEEYTLSAGIVVDEILEVESVSEKMFIEPPSFGLTIDKGFIESIIQYKEEYLILLDLPKLLTLETLSQIKEIR